MPESPTPTEGRITACPELRDLQLQYGEHILLRPAGLDYRLTTHVVGMEPRSYLIVRLSSLGMDAHHVYPHLYKDNEIKLFIANEGMLLGYRSAILAFNAAPYRHLYIAYPNEGESFTLREHDRYQCHLPAVLQGQGHNLAGMVIDVSMSGCRVCLDPPEEDTSFAPAVGNPTRLTFSLLSRDNAGSVDCEVRNVGRAKGKLVLGLRFLRLGPVSTVRLSQFLEYLSRYRRTSINSRR
jgi:hypothetical protein